MPKNTPKSIVAKINAAVVEALNDGTIRQRLNELEVEIPPPEQQTPEALAAPQRSEVEKWGPIIQNRQRTKRTTHALQKADK
jgi:tripartite-type tricarboxylate transporter receptor subunit TctC